MEPNFVFNQGTNKGCFCKNNGMDSMEQEKVLQQAKNIRFQSEEKGTVKIERNIRDYILKVHPVIKIHF